MSKQRRKRTDSQKLLEGCLAAFVHAGTLDLSLDELANEVGISKRMLIHYFGGRDEIEEGAMALFEERLRKQFAPEAFPAGALLTDIIAALWDRTTAPESKGALLLMMDLSRRAWSGSARAKLFYAEQQRLWVQLLMKYRPDRLVVEQLLQLFQGAILAYLITGDSEPGRSSLMRFLS
jgi:AcrR family transcriptional regulator